MFALRNQEQPTADENANIMMVMSRNNVRELLCISVDICVFWTLNNTMRRNMRLIVYTMRVRFELFILLKFFAPIFDLICIYQYPAERTLRTREKENRGRTVKKNQSALWWYNDNSYFTLLLHRDPRLRIPSPNDVIQWYFRLLSLLLLLLLLVLPIRLIQLAKRRDGVFRDQITNISLNIIT